MLCCCGGLVMKRIISIALVCMLCFGLVGCTKTYKGTDELIEKAREEIPISDADTTDIQYAGMSVVEDKALIWFISGNEYQGHYYLPMEVEVKGEDEYVFVRTYRPMDRRGDDIALLDWMNGYAFVINNPKCVSVMIRDKTGAHKEIIENNSYPYVFFYKYSSSFEYNFLDKDGNELPS